MPLLLAVVCHLDAVISLHALEHPAVLEWFLSALHRALTASVLPWDPQSAAHWLAARRMGTNDGAMQHHLQQHWTTGGKIPCELEHESRRALQRARVFCV